MTDDKSQAHYFPWTFSLKQDEVVWVAFEMCYFTISKHTLWLIGHVAPHQTSVINRAESWEKRSVLINSPGSAYIAGLNGKWAAVWMNGNRQRLLGQGEKACLSLQKKNVAQWAHRKDSPVQTMWAGNLWLQQICYINPAEWGCDESSPLSHNAALALRGLHVTIRPKAIRPLLCYQSWENIFCNCFMWN